MKICKQCEKELADTEFSPGQGKCKTCRRQQAKENYSAEVKQKQEDDYLLRRNNGQELEKQNFGLKDGRTNRLIGIFVILGHGRYRSRTSFPTQI